MRLPTFDKSVTCQRRQPTTRGNIQSRARLRGMQYFAVSPSVCLSNVHPDSRASPSSFSVSVFICVTSSFHTIISDSRRSTSRKQGIWASATFTSVFSQSRAWCNRFPSGITLFVCNYCHVDEFPQHNRIKICSIIDHTALKTTITGEIWRHTMYVHRVRGKVS